LHNSRLDKAEEAATIGAHLQLVYMYSR